VKNMEAILALGTPYVLCLTTVLLLLIVYSTRQKALEKRLDALVQMSRISGEVQGLDEISGPLAFARSAGGLRRWGIILTITAIGAGIAGMFSGSRPFSVGGHHRRGTGAWALFSCGVACTVRCRR
jgi:hypothetical protein